MGAELEASGHGNGRPSEDGRRQGGEDHGAKHAWVPRIPAPQEIDFSQQVDTNGSNIRLI